MRLKWVRFPKTGDWLYTSGKYLLLVALPAGSFRWYWSVGVRKLGPGTNCHRGFEPDELAAIASAEMTLDSLLAADEDACLCDETSPRNCPTHQNEHEHAQATFDVNRSTQPLLAQPPTQPPVRVYFAGADGTGKTSLCDYVHAKYDLPMLNEVARNVLAEGRKTFPMIRSTGDGSSAYQRVVFERQLSEESRLKPPYVSDRTVDNLAYAMRHARNFADLYEQVPAQYLADLRQSVVFLVRPQRGLRSQAGADPFRLLSEWEGQVCIDSVVETLLQLWRVPCLPIDEIDSAHREAFVDWALQARGFKKVRA